MHKPDDVPSDVWSVAFNLVFDGQAERVPYYAMLCEVDAAREQDATAIARAILAERERCAKVARRFVGYADSDAGSAHSREAKELAESTASWIEQEIMEPTT